MRRRVDKDLRDKDLSAMHSWPMKAGGRTASVLSHVYQSVLHYRLQAGCGRRCVYMDRA